MGNIILAVDEMGITGLELSSILKGLGIKVLEARDEYEALNILHKNKEKINAIVWTMISMNFNEYETIKRIRNMQEYENIPLLVVSKYSDKGYIIKAIELGVAEYIVKPYDEESVIKIFCKVLGLEPKNTRKDYDQEIVSFSFIDVVNKEIKGASRGGFNITLMIAAFVPEEEKKINVDLSDDFMDTISKVLISNLRDTDTVFRYGTDKLFLILPFAEKEGAVKIEKKLVNVFETNSVIKDDNQDIRLITASVTYPEDGKMRDKLLDLLNDKIEERLC